MELLITTEYRFLRTPDGGIWTQMMFDYNFWGRYLVVFDRVLVVARVHDVEFVAHGWKRSDGEGVSFEALPSYEGPWRYFQQLPRIRCITREAFSPGQAVILRIPSPIARNIEARLRPYNYPYGVEVVGDPYDAFAPGAVRHPLRPFFRRFFLRMQRQQCRKAIAAAYVTTYTLQQRYPAGPNSLTTHYSSIELPSSAFTSMERLFPFDKSSYTLITVGSLAQLYKAPDILIDAVALCIQAGLDIKLVIVGDGKHRPELEQRVRLKGLTHCISFLGQLPAGDAVREQLDRADVFVLPSRAEGLPRAMIEAMARGLPCIGSTVGGIPELLPPEDMVPPDDVGALAAKIREVITDPARMSRMSRRNLEKAKAYCEDILSERRRVFYAYLKEQTEHWLKGYQ